MFYYSFSFTSVFNSLKTAISMENTPKTTGNLPEGFIPFRTNFEAENFCGDEYVGQDGDVVVEDIKKKYPNLKPIKMNEVC